MNTGTEANGDGCCHILSMFLSSDFIKQDHEERRDMAWRYAIAISRDGRWEEAKELFKQVMEKRKRVLGGEHPSTLSSLGNLALTLGDLGYIPQ